MKTPLQTLENAVSGRFVSAVWQRNCKTLKGTTDIVQKRTAAHSLAFGVNYDAREVVKDGRESGELPAQNAGLSGFVWETPHRFLRAVKSQVLYARFSVTEKSRFTSVFLLNGKRAPFETVAPLLVAKEKPKAGGRPTVLNVAIDNLCVVRA